MSILPPRTAALAVALLALAAPAAAQSIRSVQVAADNDAFNFWIPTPRPDHDYTHGARLAVEADAAPLWGRLLPSLRPCTGREAPEARCLSTRAELGQKIFTPRQDAPDPLPGERPYAGWLYAGAQARAATHTSLRAASLEVGVTGPPSLGEEVQTRFHEMAGFWRPAGWRGQLGFEPGVAARYDGARLLLDRSARGVRVLTLAPHWGAAAGNLLTGAHGGIRARLGYGVAHPWRASRAERRPPVALYAEGGARGEWVLHNLFLDGNTFHEGPRVEKLALVGETELGAVLRVRGVALAYRVFTRSREYRTGPAAHRYSSITVSLERPL